MATFLDVSGLQYFDSIFVFLLVWIVVYGTLSWSKVLGDNKLLNVIVGLVLGLLVLTSPAGTRLISRVAPFLTVILVLILLFNVVSKMLGGNVEAFPALKGIIIMILVTIVVVGIFVELRKDYDEEQDQIRDLSNTYNVLFHPKFLGTVLILTVAVFAVALLAHKS